MLMMMSVSSSVQLGG